MLFPRFRARCTLEAPVAAVGFGSPKLKIAGCHFDGTNRAASGFSWCRSGVHGRRVLLRLQMAALSRGGFSTSAMEECQNSTASRRGGRGGGLPPPGGRQMTMDRQEAVRGQVQDESRLHVPSTLRVAILKLLAPSL